MEDDFWDEQDEWEKEDEIRVEDQAVRFRSLVDQLVDASDPDLLPGIMTKNVDLLLGMRGFEGNNLIKAEIERAGSDGDEEKAERVEAAIDYALTFAEGFVDEAVKVDSANKALLGKIVMAMGARREDAGEGGDGPAPGRAEEYALDELLERERENFTPGFLRHLEGECARIEGAPTTTPQSARLLHTLRLLRIRVLEELGKDLGEGAQVLGQLLGYDDRGERMAVLDAGLQVRGPEFAKELAALTGEALEEFPKVPGGADPGLVRIVEEVDERIKQFIEAEAPFQ